MFSRLRIVLSTNQTVLTMGNNLHDVGQCCQAAPCLPLPHISTGRFFPLSKSSHISATVLGIQRDHTTQLSHPLPPQSSEQALTAPVLAPSLLLNLPPHLHSPPQLDFSRRRGEQQITFCILGTKAVHGQLSNSCKEVCLHPSLSPNLFYHYPSLHIMELIRDLFTLLGLGLKSN